MTRFNPYQVAREAMAQSGDANEDDTADMIVDALDDAGCLDPAPQIIRTPADPEALEPDTVVLDSIGVFYPVRSYIDAHECEKPIYCRYLPAVKVSTGSHYRACREALEGETGKACGG